MQSTFSSRSLRISWFQVSRGDERLSCSSVNASTPGDAGSPGVPARRARRQTKRRDATPWSLINYLEYRLQTILEITYNWFCQMWEIITTDRFDNWFDNLDDANRGDVLAGMLLLEQRGPDLSRPYADTLNGSKFKNMKELIVQSKGDPIRVFFAFDPKRRGILLCAGNKVGNEKRFYKQMIPIADAEYKTHLEGMEKRNG